MLMVHNIFHGFRLDMKNVNVKSSLKVDLAL